MAVRANQPLWQHFLVNSFHGAGSLLRSAIIFFWAGKDWLLEAEREKERETRDMEMERANGVLDALEGCFLPTLKPRMRGEGGGDGEGMLDG